MASRTGNKLAMNILAMNELMTSELRTNELRTNELPGNKLTIDQHAMGTPTAPLLLMVQLLKLMQFLISMLLAGSLHHPDRANHMLPNSQL